MFRITSSSLSDFSIRELSKQSAQLQDLQRQLSTGLKAERPSDDPALIRKALVEADRVSRFEQHAESLNQNTARLEQAHIQTRDAQQLIVRAKTLALSARQSTDESEINIIAAELDGVLEQLTTIANTEDVNGFLFAGTRTGDRPYPESISTSNTSTYAGNQDPLQLYITGRETSTSLQPGLDVFGGAIRGPVEFLGDNGIAPGTGGSSAIGFHSIEIQHLATEYLGTSGVDAGVSSSASDTVIGQRGTHTLTINDTSGTGASGTVRLNNGVEVAFTSADTDLQVTGPAGEVVYIDTTAISAGFSGDIDIIAPMAAKGICRVGVSITTLDGKLARLLEPRAAAPRLRYQTVRALSDAGIDVTVMTAPIIPALNEEEIERLLEAAADHGAVRAGYVVLRLPHELKDVVQEWLVQHYPDRAARIINLLREMRGGKDYDAQWYQRGSGVGERARFIAARFAKAARRFKLNEVERAPLRTDLFRPPVLEGGQYRLEL